MNKDNFEQEMENTNYLIKLLNKIAETIEPNDKKNIELYVKDLARRAVFTRLKDLAEDKCFNGVQQERELLEILEKNGKKSNTYETNPD